MSNTMVTLGIIAGALGTLLSFSLAIYLGILAKREKIKKKTIVEYIALRGNFLESSNMTTYQKSNSRKKVKVKKVKQTGIEFKRPTTGPQPVQNNYESETYACLS